ncbi:MAG: hypothetical protein OEQ74_01220, partial [Gammaproteobacteria bacterium]|nr:hypothetical protein [Gammaproteobacteria bacterium]
MNIPSLTRWTALSLFVCLIAVPVVAGPLGTTFPNDPTIPIVKPVKPALPGMPDDTLPMIESRLGYMIASPILFFDNTGVLTYTAAGGVLDIDADPLAIRLNAIDPPILIFPSGGNRYVTIDAIVDNGGDLVGGVPGNDLEIFGEVTINGDTFSGMLLTGEVTGYMGEDGVGTTDFHSLRFTVTGGLLAGLYGSDIGIEITSEMSNFTGNYNVNFAGEAKGNVGVIECTGTIGDFIWLDENGNGIQDPGEPGLENVGLTLTDSDGNQTMTATDKNGFYQFTGLCAGDYTVTVDMPPPDLDPTDINAPGSNDGNDSNDPDGTPVTLTDNSSSDQTIDFGYVELLGSLGDYVWNDVNMNGVQDVDELPIEGVMVNLYACEDLNTPLGSTTTNAAGFYEFTGLAAGCYQVEFILPPDFVFSPMDQTGDGLDSDPAPTTGFTDPIFLGPGEDNPDVDAGMFVPPPVGQLGDLFWEDLNRNGIQDPGEPGIPGITVNLYDCAGNFIDSTITGAIGDYLFDMLPGGCYVVEFIPPQDCMLTLQDATNDADDSDADPNGLTTQINLADGQSDLTWDAGCYYTAGLGDFLWHDLNQNGVQDLGEPGIDGQTVTLLDENMTPTGLTTVTGPNGYYEFTGLAPGSYFVQFMAPPDFVYTGQDVGVDTLDSDANGNGKTDKIILESGEFNETIDAGVFIPNEPSISIEKSTNGEDADNPTGPFIPDGDPVLWEYVVTNDGNVPLTDVFVIDDQGVPVDCPQDTLAVGESMTCIGEGLATVDQYANLGTTCGIGPEPEFMEVCDDDPSHYFGEDPGIDIEKLTDGIDADDPNAGDAPQFEPGDTVTWTYIVSNTGNVTLTNVEVTDDQGVQVTCPLTTLAPAGEPNSTMECTASGVAEDLQNTGSTTVDGLCGSYPNRPLYENMGTATGEYADGEFVQDIDPSHYCNPPMPMIDVEKLTNGVQADDPNAGDAPQIEPGDPVEWTYLVENTGNVTLENVDVTDDQGVAVSCPQTTLDPGETMECTASGVAEDLLDTGFTTVPGKCGSFPETPLYENMGLATGETEPGDFVQDVDASHYCNPQTPDIDIEKATNGEDADLPTGPVVAVGSTVTWTYVITNTGNVPLTNVTVTDNQGVSVDCPQDTLAIGESFECTASGIAIEGQYDNVGSVVGTPPSGPPVDDFDPSHYFGALPMIDLEKLTNGEDADLPTGPVVLVGSTVTWTYIITNMGNVPLDNIVLIDSVIGPITCNEGPIPTLANNGDNFLCTVMGIATAGQYMNRGDVCGTGPLG